MTTLRAWIEPLALAVLALSAWAVAALTGGSARRESRPLLTTPPQAVQVRAPSGAYGLRLSAHAGLVLDADGRALGRLRADEATAIAQAFACRTVAPRPGLAADRCGLATPVRVEIPGRPPLLLGSVGAAHGFALLDGVIVELDADPAGLLARDPSVLREAGLGLPATITSVGAGEAWNLTGQDGWWWFGAQPQAGAWCDPTLVRDWLAALAGTRAEAFAVAPGTPAVARLTLAGRDGDRDRTVRLDDLGPAPGRAGRRLLRRLEEIDGLVVDEVLVAALAGELLHPRREALASDRALPLDPRRADRVRLGGLELRCTDGIWRSPQISDTLDQPAVLALLDALGAAKRQSDAATATVEAGQGSVSCVALGLPAALARTIAGLQPWSLRDHRIIPDLDVAAVQSLVIQPADAAPEIHTRDAQGRWPADVAADLQAVLADLAAGRVEAWSGPAPVPPPPAGCVFVVSTTAATWTLRVGVDGQVVIPQRDLAGRLDAASRAAIIGDRGR